MKTYADIYNPLVHLNMRVPNRYGETTFSVQGPMTGGAFVKLNQAQLVDLRDTITYWLETIAVENPDA